MKSKIKLIIIAASVTCAVSGNAASIVWGAAQNISGNSDVSTLGSAVLGANFVNTSGANVTVNGTTFISTNNAGTLTVGGVTMTASGYVNTRGPGTFGTTLEPYNSLSTEYKTLLSSAYDRDVSVAQGTGSWTVTLSGLILGRTYQLQGWANDPRIGGSTTRVSTFTDGTNGVAVKLNAAEIAGTPGQFVVGTFTADSTSQAFNISTNATTATNTAMLSALQVRDITGVPEPTTAILAMSGLGLFLIRRRSL